jgi:hypothetical protein
MRAVLDIEHSGLRPSGSRRESGRDLSCVARGIHSAGLRGTTRRATGHAAQAADRLAHQTLSGWKSRQRMEGTGREYRIAAPRGALPDPTDDYFLLALVEEGEADCLVTGDRNGLPALSRHKATRIVSASGFSALLA